MLPEKEHPAPPDRVCNPVHTIRASDPDRTARPPVEQTVRTTTESEITTPDLSRVPRPLATGSTHLVPYSASVTQGISRRLRRRQRLIYASPPNSLPRQQLRHAFDRPEVFETQFTTDDNAPVNTQKLKVRRRLWPAPRSEPVLADDRDSE